MAGMKPLAGLACGGGLLAYTYYASQQLYFMEADAISRNDVHWTMLALHDALGRQGTVTAVGGTALFIVVVSLIAMLRLNKR